MTIQLFSTLESTNRAMEALSPLLATFNKPLNAQFKEELETPVLFVDGVPTLKIMFGVWLPFTSYSTPYNDSPLLLQAAKSLPGHTAVLLHCLKAPLADIPIEAHTTSEIHFYDGGSHVLGALNSKRRNDVKAMLKTAQAFRLVPESEAGATIVSHLPAIIREWAVKTNSHGYDSAAFQAVVWTNLAFGTQRYRLYESEDRGTLVSYVWYEGRWWLHALHDMSWDTRTGAPRPRQGSAAIYTHLNAVEEPTLLTNGKISPNEPEEYQLYKKKFSTGMEQAYAVYLTPTEVYPPYVKVPEWTIHTEVQAEAEGEVSV